MSRPLDLPRLVIGAPASGHGKTTVATGLMLALRRRGLEVAGFKVGPDYIDPGYHALATGRPGRNLDAFLCGADLVAPLLRHGAGTPRRADVAVIEGAMGLFDGRLGGAGFASTGHVATLTASPVVLVVDVGQATRTVGAVVLGCSEYDPEVRLSGVILNKVATARHAREVRSGLDRVGVQVLGELPRDAGISVPSRHLGLVPAAEREQSGAALDRLAGQIAEHVDLDAVLAVARTAAPLEAAGWDPATVVHPPGRRRDVVPPAGWPARSSPVVAIAGGRAFTFRYPETEELLRAAGCQPVVIDPLTDAELPEGTCGLYLGGGFPQVHSTQLSGNTALREAIRTAVRSGMPTVAECAGLLYLCRSVDGEPMVGAVPATAAMGPRLWVGYREATAPAATLLADPDEPVRGHEFHRTVTTSDTPPGPEVSQPGWLWTSEPDGITADGFSLDPAGTGRPTLHASYLHTHWAGAPRLAQRFADAVHAYAEDTRRRNVHAS